MSQAIRVNVSAGRTKEYNVSETECEFLSICMNVKMRENIQIVITK
ncbi:MAG: hypothetical protein AABX35_02860 [Nanoarchaeota archaeon]